MAGKEKAAQPCRTPARGNLGLGGGRRGPAWRSGYGGDHDLRSTTKRAMSVSAQARSAARTAMSTSGRSVLAGRALCVAAIDAALVGEGEGGPAQEIRSAAHGLEVRRVDAGTVAAQVVDIETVGRRAIDPDEGDPMGVAHATLPDVKAPVARRVLGASPIEATVKTGDNVASETAEGARCERGSVLHADAFSGFGMPISLHQRRMVSPVKSRP